jgi:hypothetical protein|eukprot:COSAG02_NODE_1_length_108762_cov_456.708287_1_plen_102_part_00
MDPRIEIVRLSFVHRYVELAKLEPMTVPKRNHTFTDPNVVKTGTRFLAAVHSLRTVEEVRVVSDTCSIQQNRVLSSFEGFLSNSSALASIARRFISVQDFT